MDLPGRVRAFGKHVLGLFFSLAMGAVAGLPFEGGLEPRTPSRAVAVVVFHAVLLFVFARDDVVATWRYLRDGNED
jgi:hypothetical protein